MSQLFEMERGPLMIDLQGGVFFSFKCDPLIFRYRLTKIAVDNTAGPYENHTVVFLGSEKGIILKFLARIGSSGFLNGSLFLEEMNVYNPEK